MWLVHPQCHCAGEEALVSCYQRLTYLLSEIASLQQGDLILAHGFYPMEAVDFGGTAMVG